MNNTLKISASLEVRIGLFIQIPVPDFFNNCETEEEVQKLSLFYSGLLKNQYKLNDILLISAANNIKGEHIVACLMELSWMDRSNGFKSCKLILLWFQEGYAFPINPHVEQSIQKVRFDILGIVQESPF